jgi:hypothetical protein
MPTVFDNIDTPFLENELHACRATSRSRNHVFSCQSKVRRRREEVPVTAVNLSESLFSGADQVQRVSAAEKQVCRQDLKFPTYLRQQVRGHGKPDVSK